MRQDKDEAEKRLKEAGVGEGMHMGNRSIPLRIFETTGLPMSDTGGDTRGPKKPRLPQLVRQGKRGRLCGTTLRSASLSHIGRILGVDEGTTEMEHMEDESEMPFSQYENRRRLFSVTSYLSKYKEPDDPRAIEDLQTLWFLYGDIFLSMSESEISEAQLGDISRKIACFKQGLMETLPYKGGEMQGWSFPKNHELDYIPWAISQLGNLEVSNTQYGEHCHTSYVKKDCAKTNRHAGTLGLSVLVRDSLRSFQEQLQHVPDTARAVEILQVMDGSGADNNDGEAAGSNHVGKGSPSVGGVDCEALDFGGSEEDESGISEHEIEEGARAGDACGETPSHGKKKLPAYGGRWTNCEKLCIPLHKIAREHLHSERKVHVPGGPRKTRRPFTEALFALSCPDLVYAQDNKAFEHIQGALAKYLWRVYVAPTLPPGDQEETPTPQQLNQTLESLLPGGRVTLWSCMDIKNKAVAENEMCRIRAYPWPSRKFHGKNRAVSIPESWSKFCACQACKCHCRH
jgi:hypothetical protein